jgi:shikimate kinase
VSAEADEPGSRSIALVGFMASGKSTIGRGVAARLDLPFTDSDNEIEKSFGLSVPEIFERHGEAKFRQAEREIILRLLAGPPQVVSLGGGACEDEVTRVALIERARTVWLDPPFDVVLARLGRSNSRPLATGRSPAELRRLWDERREGYSVADYRVVTSDDHPAAAVDRIVELLGA